MATKRIKCTNECENCGRNYDVYVEAEPEANLMSCPWCDHLPETEFQKMRRKSECGECGISFEVRNLVPVEYRDGTRRDICAKCESSFTAAEVIEDINSKRNKYRILE